MRYETFVEGRRWNLPCTTGEISCDGSNHEEWEKYGNKGECYVCY